MSLSYDFMIVQISQYDLLLAFSVEPNSCHRGIMFEGTNIPTPSRRKEDVCYSSCSAQMFGQRFNATSQYRCTRLYSTRHLSSLFIYILFHFK